MAAVRIMASTARAVTAVAAVAAVASMATMIGERDAMVLPERLEKCRAIPAVVRRCCCLQDIGRERVAASEAGRDERGDEEGAAHSGVTPTRSASGCHSKKPAHASRSVHPPHAGAYLRFQSEIDAGARSR